MDGLTDAMGGDIVFVWNFLNCFGEGLGLPSTSVEALVDALALGQRSVLLSELHICLLRLLQSDMEEAHYNNSLQSGKVRAVAAQGLARCLAVRSCCGLATAAECRGALGLACQQPL